MFLNIATLKYDKKQTYFAGDLMRLISHKVNYQSTIGFLFSLCSSLQEWAPFPFHLREVSYLPCLAWDI